MESVVLQPLNSLEHHLNLLVTSLTQTNTFAKAPQIANDLLSDDDSLTSSLNLLQRHQQNYARILNLRSEVADLQDQLKDTIRRCVTLRQEIGQVHPSILESSDSGDDDEEVDEEADPKAGEVNYHTLLSFAARIGKHNAVAAREAEAESVRRKVAAAQAKNTFTATSTSANGVSGPSNTVHDVSAMMENATAETEAEIARIDNTIALNRAQMGMAFPDANALRVGALGQLQLFLEQQQQMGGSDESIQQALEREVERMVRETEDVADAEEADEAGDDVEMGLSPELARTRTEGTLEGSQARQAGRRASQSMSTRPPPVSAPKKKIDLDFPSSDEED